MGIRFEKGINKDNAVSLCEWSNEKGKDFQEQWMGPKTSYPLSYDKIKGLENLFSIFDEQDFIGVIQKVRIDKDNIHIGRFVLDPRKTGFASERSGQLLLETKLPISEIAYQLGFQYSQHFTRLFKSRTGMTPNEYRLTA